PVPRLFPGSVAVLTRGQASTGPLSGAYAGSATTRRLSAPTAATKSPTSFRRWIGASAKRREQVRETRRLKRPVPGCATGQQGCCVSRHDPEPGPERRAKRVLLRWCCGSPEAEYG